MEKVEVLNTASGYGAPWKQQYHINNGEFLSGWIPERDLPEVIGDGQVVITKNKVYYLGGFDNISYVPITYVAQINEDGTIGEWAKGPNLPEKLGDAQVIVAKNKVYLLGGFDDINYVPTTYVAPIDEDGVIGEWTKGPDLPEPLGVSQAVVIKNKVYLFGGFNGNNWTSAVYVAPIDEDGVIGKWAKVSDLPEPLGVSQAAVVKDKIYLIGGYNGDRNVNVIYSSTINSDGSLSEWSNGPQLPEALSESCVLVTKNKVYLIGGHNGKNHVNTVYIALINDDGTLGEWVKGPCLPEGLGWSQVAVTKNKVYLFGGLVGDNYVSKIYAASITGGLNDYSPYYGE